MLTKFTIEWNPKVPQGSSVTDSQPTRMYGSHNQQVKLTRDLHSKKPPTRLLANRDGRHNNDNTESMTTTLYSHDKIISEASSISHGRQSEDDNIRKVRDTRETNDTPKIRQSAVPIPSTTLKAEVNTLSPYARIQLDRNKELQDFSIAKLTSRYSEHQRSRDEVHQFCFSGVLKPWKHRYCYFC